MCMLGSSGGKDRVQGETTEPKHVPDTVPGLRVTGDLRITQAPDALAGTTGSARGALGNQRPAIDSYKVLILELSLPHTFAVKFSKARCAAAPIPAPRISFPLWWTL